MKRLPAETVIPPNPRHRAFAEAFFVEKQGAKAARAVGYAVSSARVQACRLLKREDVQAYIRELKANPPASPTVEPGSPEWIRERYQAIASVSAADFVTPDEDGKLRWKRPDELTPDQRAAVAEIKTVRPRRWEAGDGGLKIAGYKLYSARDATDALARLSGLHREPATQHHSIDVRHVFELAARSEGTSETSARLRARHGSAGARFTDS